MPRSQSDLALLDGLGTGVLTRIGDLFDVRQGIRAGHACFLITQDEYEALRAKEREYFRPSATNATIQKEGSSPVSGFSIHMVRMEPA